MIGIIECPRTVFKVGATSNGSVVVTDGISAVRMYIILSSLL